MSLMKNDTFDLTDQCGPGGTVKLGAGHTFSEAHFKTSQKGRIMASGWASTVGIGGWSLGYAYIRFVGIFLISHSNSCRL